MTPRGFLSRCDTVRERCHTLCLSVLSGSRIRFREIHSERLKLGNYLWKLRRGKLLSPLTLKERGRNGEIVQTEVFEPQDRSGRRLGQGGTELWQKSRSEQSGSEEDISSFCFAFWSPSCVCLEQIQGSWVTDCVRFSLLKYGDTEGQITNRGERMLTK